MPRHDERLVRALGVTVLAALHDLDQAAAHADRIAVLAGLSTEPETRARRPTTSE